MGAVFVLLFALFFYLIYRALRGKGQTASAPADTAKIAYHGNSYPSSEILPDPRFPHLRSIHTKIRGVTYTNPDGADRQKIIQQWCHSGDALWLYREPENPADCNAIAVRRVVCSDAPDNPRVEEQLGYLSRELAEELAPDMDKRGHILMAHIMEVTGGDGGHSLGVNIQVEEYIPAQEAAHPKEPASRRKKKVLPRVSR
jgi:HIRAN domain